MYMVVIKGGLLFGTIMSLLVGLQTQPVLDLVVAFVADGIIPGTNLEVPAEITLLTVAAAMMMICAVLTRGYVRRQAALQLLMRQYETRREDPTFSALVPGLGKALQIGRTVRTRAGDAWLRPYARLRHVFGRPVSAQAITLRESTTNLLIRIDRWSPDRTHLRQVLLSFFAVLGRWENQARTYMARITMFW